MKSFWRALYHKHISRTLIHTVQLRGRLTDADNKFIKTSASRYILSARNLVKKVKSSTKPVFLEIGFGNGDHIVGLAKTHKDTLVLGSEMYMAGVVNTLRSRQVLGLENIFVTSSDAREVLTKIPNNSVDRVYTLFPDPWPKARHNKRRLVKIQFTELVLLKLKTGGLCIIATDWPEYATQITEVFKVLKSRGLVYETSLPGSELNYIYETTFAKRAIKEAREISVFVLGKIK